MDEEVMIRANLVHDLIPVFTDYDAGQLGLQDMLRAAADIEAFILGGDDDDVAETSDGWPDAQDEVISPGYERDRQTFENFQRDAQHQFDYDNRYYATGGAAKNPDKLGYTR